MCVEIYNLFIQQQHPRVMLLPYFYGMLTLLWSALPGIALFGLWLIFETSIIEYVIVQELPADVRDNSTSHLGLIINQVYNIAYSEKPP